MADRFRRFARWSIAVICHYGGFDALYRRIAGPGLTVLMFHRIRDERDPYPLSISPPSFAQLVAWLRARDWLASLDRGLADLAASRPGVRYALTFDDGYRDNLNLLNLPTGAPPAIIYLATGHIGGPSIWAYELADAMARRRAKSLDLDDLGLGRWTLERPEQAERCLLALTEAVKSLPARELERRVQLICTRLDPSPPPASASGEMLDWDDTARLAAAGIEIGAQTVHHAILSRVDAEQAREEIVESRDAVAAHVGQVRHFAYPNGGAGDFGERDVALVREAGFATAVSTLEGVNRRGVDPFRLRRHNVHETRFRSPFGGLSRALFFSETSGLLDWLRTHRAPRAD